MPSEDVQEPFARVNVDEGKDMMSRDDVAVIDVRETNEYNGGHIPNAKLIPVATVFARRNEIPPDKDILFVCQVGQRSALACEMAAAAGFTRLFNLEGGTEAWIKAGYPVEK
jgi:rhodanese-related sulfurtransferase